MATIVHAYFWLLKGVVALLLAAMVVLVFGNVVLRYVFNSGISVSEELSRWMFVWLVFLGATIGLRDHAHLGVDTLVKILPRAGRQLCYAISHLLMLFASILLTEGSWKQMILNADTTAPASNLSVGIFYAAGVVFGASAVLIIVYELYLLARGRIADADLIAVSESEDLPPPIEGADRKPRT